MPAASARLACEEEARRDYPILRDVDILFGGAELAKEVRGGEDSGVGKPQGLQVNDGVKMMGVENSQGGD